MSAPTSHTVLASLRTNAWRRIPEGADYESGFHRGWQEARRNPQPKRGEHSFQWADELAEYIEVHYEYTPAEAQTWDHPGYPSECIVTAAYLHGVDILPLLSEDKVERMAEKAEEAINDARADALEARAAARWEERDAA